MHTSVPAAFVFLCYAATVAAQAPSENVPFEAEVKRQSEIYNSSGAQVPEGYVVARSLDGYTFMLPSSFKLALAGLKSDDRWLDIGAGEGRAVIDYCTSASKGGFLPAAPPSARATAVAMSIEDRRTAEWKRAAECAKLAKIQYLSGRRLQEYSAQELGRYMVITDVLGGFSYTRYPAIYMAKTLEALAVNGSLFTVLQDVQFDSGSNRPHYEGAGFLTEIVDKSGSPIKVCSWLKRISCVEVVCIPNEGTVPPVEMYRVHKTCEDTRIPSLNLTGFSAGTPPERRFVMESPASGGAAPQR